MFFFFTPKYYIFVFLTLIILIPLIILSPMLIFQQTQVFYILLLIANVLGMVFTWRRNSSKHLSFLKGLEIITKANMSGCANLTMIYIFPVLLIAYSTAFFNAVLGLKKGKKFTEQKWIQVVDEYEVLSPFR